MGKLPRWHPGYVRMTCSLPGPLPDARPTEAIAASRWGPRKYDEWPVETPPPPLLSSPLALPSALRLEDRSGAHQGAGFTPLHARIELARRC